MLDAAHDGLCPMVRLISTGPRYTADDLRAAFPKATKSKRSTNRGEGGDPGPRDKPRTEDIQRIIDAAEEHFRHWEPHLWAGDWAEAINALTGKERYPSQSEADLALAAMIAHWLAEQGVSAEDVSSLVEAIFERSGLALRAKWQSRADYRESTIGMACADVASRPASTCGGAAGVDWSLKNDLRTARFFANRCRGRFLFVHDRGEWLRWADERWHWCYKGEQIEAAKDTGVALVAEAAKVEAKYTDSTGKLVREVSEAQKLPRIEAMLKLASSEPGLSAVISELDVQPTLLGVSNGVVDLRKGVLLNNLPDLMITRHCEANYLPTARCSRWRSFLDEVFQGDQDTIGAVQRLLGLTLTGITSEELMVFSVGAGLNGKSIFGNVISSILGDYAVTAPSSLLAARRSDDTGARGDLAMLAGARLASINELPGGMRLDETVAKQLAGREPISARFLYKEYFAFDPTFTPWVRTNHKPIIKGADDGIWRRLLILRFGRTFTPEEQDPDLEEKLLAERDGILGWMVHGAQIYLTKGLHISAAMRRETAQYRTASDVLGEFLDECTEAGSDLKVDQRELFKAWRNWCNNNGHHSGAKGTFTERLQERGYTVGKSGCERFYVGLQATSSGGGIWTGWTG